MTHADSTCVESSSVVRPYRVSPSMHAFNVSVGLSESRGAGDFRLPVQHDPHPVETLRQLGL